MSPLAEALDLAREARDLLSGGAFSQETAADLDGSGLDLRDCRFQSCRFRTATSPAPPFTAAFSRTA